MPGGKRKATRCRYFVALSTFRGRLWGRCEILEAGLEWPLAPSSKALTFPNGMVCCTNCPKKNTFQYRLMYRKLKYRLKYRNQRKDRSKYRKPY